jgi:predicted Zn-dependent peptidase
MDAAEAGTNALIPAILLRGCRSCPDLKQITERLDDLYGASIGTLVRRIGDYQSTGFYCGFIEDRFALEGDAILSPMLEFVSQLLLDPILEEGGFSIDFTESEKRNLISAIESDRSNKGAYAAGQLLKLMCREDSFGIPRLGEIAQIHAIDHRSAWAHYQKILRESPVEIFYVGSAEMETVSDLLRPVFMAMDRDPHPLPPQSAYHFSPQQYGQETQQVAQANLSMGLVTPITNRDPRFAAMQICNAIFGGGQTSKLFMQVREARQLCYAIGSGYYGSKGIMTINAGIDTQQESAAREAILAQLEACKAGNITQEELAAAKESILSGLQAVYDSPGAMEGYFSTAAISGLARTPESYSREIREVTLADVTAAAQTVTVHSTFILKGAAHA